MFSIYKAIANKYISPNENDRKIETNIFTSRDKRKFVQQ